MLLPNVTWGQSKTFVYVTFDFFSHHSISKVSTPVCSNKKFDESLVKINLTEKDIQIKTDLYEVFLPFFDYVKSDFLEKFFGDGILKIKLQKAEKKFWKNLCNEKADKKVMQIIKRDWEKWNMNSSDNEYSSSDNEEEKKGKKDVRMNLNEINESNTLSLNFDIKEEDKQDIVDSPTLDIDNFSLCLNYFKNNMTSAQKMLTLAHMWNKSSVEERKIYMKSMIDIIVTDKDIEADVKLQADSIKGGEECLCHLNLDEYIKNKITFCTNWVDVFSDFDTEKRTKTLCILFTELSNEEKKIVLSTFF